MIIRAWATRPAPRGGLKRGTGTGWAAWRRAFAWRRRPAGWPPSLRATRPIRRRSAALKVRRAWLCQPEGAGKLSHPVLLFLPLPEPLHRQKACSYPWFMQNGGHLHIQWHLCFHSRLAMSYKSPAQLDSLLLPGFAAVVLPHNQAAHFAPGVVHFGNNAALCHILAHALLAGTSPALSAVRASGARHAPGTDSSIALAPAPAPMERRAPAGAAQPAKQAAGRLMPFSVLKACRTAYLKQIMQHMQSSVLKAEYAAIATRSTAKVLRGSCAWLQGGM